MRGRQEYGPRALGHRSLLAVPDASDIKARLNRLKGREFYRPVAPMIASEALEAVVDAFLVVRLVAFDDLCSYLLAVHRIVTPL